MRPQRKLHFTRDIFSAFHIFPLDYFSRRYCIFQEDAIMTQQTHRLKPAVVMATFCVILAALCNLPQVLSLGSECYTITGLDYRGTQNKIELPPDLSDAKDFIQSTACLPWNSSIESRKPRARERGIGPHNYCRNPDEDIMPWCKVPGVAGSDGAWGYCHVPECKVPGYLGCFLDKGQPPALDGVNILHKSMTVGSCLAFCRKQGFRYAGLEAGHACYCGNGGYNRYGTTSERGTHCAIKCFGNKGQPCGGDGYVDVYRTNIGACGSATPMRDAAGAVYSPGYPDFPSSVGLANSLSAAEVMMERLRERLDLDIEVAEDSVDQQSANSVATVADKPCEWKVQIDQALDVKMLIRKIDPKQKLGGVVEIEADDGASITVSLSDPSVTSSNKNVTSFNVTDPPPPPLVAAKTLKSPIMWFGDSKKARGEIDVIIPDDATRDDNRRRRSTNGESRDRPRWSEVVSNRKTSRYVLPSNTIQPMVSVTGGRFTIRFLRSPELVASQKSTLDPKRQRPRSRKKTSEWSRFVVEYEATLPDGVTIVPDDVISDVINGVNNGDTGSYPGRKHKQTHKNTRKNPNAPEAPGDRATRHRIRPPVTNEDLGQTRFTISEEDAKAIKDAISSADPNSNEGGKSPIKIEVFVEPIPGDRPTGEGGVDNKNAMSEFTIPLLLAVLLTTTAILILAAVLVIFRRGGITSKKPEKNQGLVVACHPRDGARAMKKSTSDSNLSSSSTADSLLLTDSDASKYSPRMRHEAPPPVSPAALKNLMEILKGHPGILNRPPLDAEEYKQISSHPSYITYGPDGRGDVTPLPGPCPYCCGCAEDNRAHRHGDSCRTHHNQGKYGKAGGTLSAPVRQGGPRNTRGLVMRGCLKANATSQQQGMSAAPPLSPISEVSSVTSSMMSLPITSSNSQTSLLSRHGVVPQAPKNSQRKSVKKEDLVGLGPEAEAFLAPESDAESGVGDLRAPSSESSLPIMDRVAKLRFSGEKMIPGRYLGGVAGACYDSGYATSNYEEDDEEKLKNELREKMNFDTNGSDVTSTRDANAASLINP